MSFDPNDRRIIHVHPTRVDLPDIFHEGHGARVVAPLPECVLCDLGICVQRLSEECAFVVVHGRSADA
jgi:hypothetical protein